MSNAIFRPAARLRQLAAAIMASALLLPLTGCSTAVGTDLEPRVAVLQTMRDQGWLFNKHVIDTVYGKDQNQVIVSGPLAHRTPDNRHVPNGYLVTQFGEAVLEKQADGHWQIVAATKVVRDQLTTRERWLNGELENPHAN